MRGLPQDFALTEPYARCGVRCEVGHIAGDAVGEDERSGTISLRVDADEIVADQGGLDDVSL